MPAEPSPPAPPSVPNYQLLRRIGQGSFGEVWLARNALGAFRAVKVIHRAAFEDPADYEREFAGVRHFEPLSREHPGLVDLLDVGVNAAEGFFYYAMELADDGGPRPDAGCRIPEGRDSDSSPSATAPASGIRYPASGIRHQASGILHQASGIRHQASGIRHPASGIRHQASSLLDPATYTPLTLSARLHTEHRLPLAECLRVGVALTDALEFLHARGLIHRDIKPSNIIFVGGVPKLADVGTVTRVDEAKTMVGTEGFKAPEGPGKPQADLYSLGEVLYEISTGKDRQRFPEPLTKLADLLDRARWQEFSAVVDKACQPEPTRRYPSTTELRADLLTIEAGRSVRRQWLLDLPAGENDQRRLTSAATAPTALRSFTLPNGETITNFGALAMTPDGKFVAASGTTTRNRTLCAVWNGTNGSLLFVATNRAAFGVPALAGSGDNHSPGDRLKPGLQTASPAPSHFPTDTLALTPDGSLLAAGNDDGQATVWRILPADPAAGSRGRESAPTSPAEENDQRRLTSAATEPLAQIPASRLPTLSLAFCRDYVRDPLHPALEPRWLLATGDSGGGVAIWELPAAQCAIGAADLSSIETPSLSARTEPCSPREGERRLSSGTPHRATPY